MKIGPPGGPPWEHFGETVFGGRIRAPKALKSIIFGVLIGDPQKLGRVDNGMCKFLVYGGPNKASNINPPCSDPGPIFCQRKKEAKKESNLNII